MANNWKGRGLEMSRTIDVAESFKIFKEPSRTELFKGTTQRSTRPIHNRWKKNDFQLNDSLALSQKPKKRTISVKGNQDGGERSNRRMAVHFHQRASRKPVRYAGEPPNRRSRTALSLSLSLSQFNENKPDRPDRCRGRSGVATPPAGNAAANNNICPLNCYWFTIDDFLLQASLSLSLSLFLISKPSWCTCPVCVCVCVRLSVCMWSMT